MDLPGSQRGGVKLENEFQDLHHNTDAIEAIIGEEAKNLQEAKDK